MNGLKQSAIALLESTLLKTGTVLGVRYWEPLTFVEIDLHLPGLDMSNWELAQHIKCRVAPIVYRDYSLAGWDEETHTCTLYIDAGHNGPGSRWAKSVQPGDVLQYAGCGSSSHAPEPLSRLICLGDESAVGHFLSMWQLLPRSSTLSGAITFSEPGHRRSFADYLHVPLEALAAQAGSAGSGSPEALRDWLDGIDCGEEGMVFYLMGNMRMVQAMRKTLKEKGVAPNDIRVHGFWR